MSNLFRIPIDSIISLTAKLAVLVIEEILLGECRYAKISPNSLTISKQLNIADGGIDAEILVPNSVNIPSDCLFQHGLTGFQIKSGTVFKPWTKSAIKNELIQKNGELYPEVKRILKSGGAYTLVCTGHDLTSEQRNKAQQNIRDIFNKLNIGSDVNICVMGASQIANFAERYVGTLSILNLPKLDDALTFYEWAQVANMSNELVDCSEQIKLIAEIRKELHGDVKHIRLIGEPGIGKTRLVLEALRDKAFSPYVLYVSQGSRFGQSDLFRQLLRSNQDTPLILVIDDLSSSEMADIWSSLKNRCGYLKIISLDHHVDNSFDIEILKLSFHKLSDDAILQILINKLGDQAGLNRWVKVCEGSPRVAIAIADNLEANPDDLLKEPATVPIWSRFLHGHVKRDEQTARQINCVAYHLALFKRFGYEDSVADEAEYIFSLINQIDPTIGWARYQEIIQQLRGRRTLQGSKTLFFVPKAFHIYLWKHFWQQYGRRFNFIETLENMPKSLHGWFMAMFKYADDKSANNVLDEVLSLDGYFSHKSTLTSDTGSRLMTVLAEADPRAVLNLLEAITGTLSRQHLLESKNGIFNIVYELRKIAVWFVYAVRALRVMSHLISPEDLHDHNNSLIRSFTALFRIGPEYATTEATPDARLVVILELMRSNDIRKQRLSLKSIQAALSRPGTGYRCVGLEFQALRERASLWTPATHNDWWEAVYKYFKSFVDETLNWNQNMTAERDEALFSAIENLILIPTCTDLAFEVLERLINKKAIKTSRFTAFFRWTQHYVSKNSNPELLQRLSRLERNYQQSSLGNRFQSYVLDAKWHYWEIDKPLRNGKPANRTQALIAALTKRFVKKPASFSEIRELLSPDQVGPASHFFGIKIAQEDSDYSLLSTLIELSLDTKHTRLLAGYMSELSKLNHDAYINKLNQLLETKETAWLGAMIVLESDYKADLFKRCLHLLRKGWIDLPLCNLLSSDSKLKTMPKEQITAFFDSLKHLETEHSLSVLVNLLGSPSFDCLSTFDTSFVLDSLTKYIKVASSSFNESKFFWEQLCIELMSIDDNSIAPLLDTILYAVTKNLVLGYEQAVINVVNKLFQLNASECWRITKQHLQKSLPDYPLEVIDLLKGNTLYANGSRQNICPIAEIPLTEIFDWIEKDPKQRAALIADTVPVRFDDSKEGLLTRKLLSRYGHIPGVEGGISSTFISGTYTGTRSQYFRNKRQVLREWLSKDLEPGAETWIQKELDYLNKKIEDEVTSEERRDLD